jgi:hypothetical protein
VRLRRLLATAALALIGTALTAAQATAGPPYTTDDPEPTRTGGWENYVLVTGVQTPGDSSGQAGIELNYGGAKDLQLSLVLPLGFDHASHTEVGPGQVQVGAKYRFLHQTRFLPDVAFFPAVFLPTQARGLGPTRLGLFLPLWEEKDFGAWSTFGGGGVDINPGPGARNYTLTGWAVTRQATKKLNLGVELWHETPSRIGVSSLTALAGGIIWQVSKHYALMGTAGPGLQGDRRAGQGVFYLSLQYTD